MSIIVCENKGNSEGRKLQFLNTRGITLICLCHVHQERLKRENGKFKIASIYWKYPVVSN